MKETHVGKYVLFNDCGGLKVGIVVKESPKTVIVANTPPLHELAWLHRAPSYGCRIDKSAILAVVTDFDLFKRATDTLALCRNQYEQVRIAADKSWVESHNRIIMSMNAHEAEARKADEREDEV